MFGTNRVVLNAISSDFVDGIAMLLEPHQSTYLFFSEKMVELVIQNYAYVE